jgi:hypothetical protein
MVMGVCAYPRHLSRYQSRRLYRLRGCVVVRNMIPDSTQVDVKDQDEHYYPS